MSEPALSGQARANKESLRDTLDNVQDRVNSCMDMVDTVLDVISSSAPKEVARIGDKNPQREPLDIRAQMLRNKAESVQDGLRRILEALG